MSEVSNIIYLRTLFLFKDLQEAELNQIAARVKFKQLAAGDVLNYGDGPSSKVYFLVAGKIKVAEMDIENELVRDILTSDEIFGDLQLEGKPNDFEFGEALTDNTNVAYMHAADFTFIIESFPKVAVAYAKRISIKLKRIEQRYADLIRSDVRSRFIRFIKDWARADGNPLDDKMILNNYLTHGDIAGVISTSRQTVTILFNEMRDSGILHYNRKFIQINNWQTWN